MGILLITPVILTWTTPWQHRWSWANIVEPTIAFMLLLLVSGIAFNGWFTPINQHLPLTFMPFPFLIWIALRQKSIGSLE